MSPVYSKPAVYSDIPIDVMSTVPPYAITTAASLSAANRAVLARVLCKKSGFLRDMSVSVGLAAGNVELGVYDTGDTTAAVRTKIASSGSIACPAAATTPMVPSWDPGAGVVPVVAGRYYDYWLSWNDVTATFHRIVVAWQPPVTFGAAAGTSAVWKPMSLYAAAFAAPGAIAEASLNATFQFPVIMGRVSAT